MRFVLKNIGSDDVRFIGGMQNGKYTQCLILDTTQEDRCVAHLTGFNAKAVAMQLLSALNQPPAKKIQRGSYVITNFKGDKERNIFLAHEDESDDCVYIKLSPQFVFKDGMFHQKSLPCFSATVWNDPVLESRNYVPLNYEMLQG